MEAESNHFSPYRSDGKLYGFVCVVTGKSTYSRRPRYVCQRLVTRCASTNLTHILQGANQPIGAAIVTELAGK